VKLVVVAATGGIGHHLLDEAHRAGHDVTAVARTPARVRVPAPVVAADLATAEPGDLAAVVVGSTQSCRAWAHAVATRSASWPAAPAPSPRPWPRRAPTDSSS
jgi:putative NADH-flavin reductase